MASLAPNAGDPATTGTLLPPPSSTRPRLLDVLVILVGAVILSGGLAVWAFFSTAGQEMAGLGPLVATWIFLLVTFPLGAAAALSQVRSRMGRGIALLVTLPYGLLPGAGAVLSVFAGSLPNTLILAALAAPFLWVSIRLLRSLPQAR